MRYSFYYNDELYVPVMVNGVEAFMETQYFVNPITINITIQKDGVALTNTAITVNNKSYTTNSSGQISMTGESGITENYFFYLSDTYWGNFDITFSSSVTNTVNLEIHVVAGSVEWGNIHTIAFDQITIPNNVTIIKVIEDRNFWSDGEDSGYGVIGICRGSVSNWGAFNSKPSSEKILWSYDDETERTHYVGVTQNQVYTVYRVEAHYTKIEWSDEINLVTPEKTI